MHSQCSGLSRICNSMLNTTIDRATSEDVSSLKPSFTSFLWPFDYERTKFVTTSVSVSGYQAVSGGNQQVDQSAWSVTAVPGIGRQVPHGSQVWCPPSHRAVPQLQGKERERKQSDFQIFCSCTHTTLEHVLSVVAASGSHIGSPHLLKKTTCPSVDMFAVLDFPTY